jgi:NAD(P)-dependent dehydrogenase (short-subunit alcohol dehydrogenase family)
MSVKSTEAAGYLERQKTTHVWKKWGGPRQVLLTGDANLNSIGAFIGERLRSQHVTVTSFQGDVRSFVPGDWHTYDTLIACHGVTHLDWFEDISLEKAREIFDVNLFGSFAVAQKFVQATISQPYRKRIIFIGSMAYTKVLNGSAAYCASKAGLAMLTRCLAWELAPKGYDVYCVHPSNVEGTPMSEETIQGLMRYRRIGREAAEAYWSDTVLRDHQLTKDEIAFTVRVLLTSGAEYMAGSNIELAGGAR